jgi:DNA-binding NtrC family response regulator
VGVKSETPYDRAAFDRKLSIEDYTKNFILQYQAQFNEQQLADLLGITRKSLWEKRKKWGLQKER